jgi:hypothetical protein
MSQNFPLFIDSDFMTKRQLQKEEARKNRYNDFERNKEIEAKEEIRFRQSFDLI